MFRARARAIAVAAVVFAPWAAGAAGVSTGTIPLVPFFYASEETSKMLAVAAREREHKQGFFGRIALGYLASRGNTDAATLNSEVDLGYVTGPWRHAWRLQGTLGSANGVRNAQSSRFSAQSDYTFTDRNYAFAALDSNYDRFGPYKVRVSTTTGLGRRLIDTPEHGLDTQLGVGSSWTRRPGEDVVQEGVLAAAVRYEWKISERAALSERINVEARSRNTYSESVTALTTNIQGTLALSVSYSIRHNSVVPPDLHKNDSSTAVSLIYGF